jgi:hypothetical protein
MKQQAIQYLALDVHQATTVATVRDESGAIRMRERCRQRRKRSSDIESEAIDRLQIARIDGLSTTLPSVEPLAELSVPVYCAGLMN